MPTRWVKSSCAVMATILYEFVLCVQHESVLDHRHAKLHNEKMDSNFRSWLDRQLKELSLTPTAFARESGTINQPTVQRILSGETESPGLKVITKIEFAVQALRLSRGLPNDFYTTTEDKKQDQSDLVYLSEHPDLLAVPRVKFKLSAGVSGYSVEPENGNGKPVFFRKDWFELHNYKPNKLLAVRVSGSSMEPSLWDDDLVVINTEDTKPHDGDVFAINYEGELVIKRMRRDAGEWFACSDNADQRRFSPKRCTEDVQIIGRVVYKQSERI